MIHTTFRQVIFQQKMKDLIQIQEMINQKTTMCGTTLMMANHPKPKPQQMNRSLNFPTGPPHGRIP